jgi:transcriptional regulator with XRE-family HTH domain
MKDIVKKFGRNLRRIREKRKLTQQELSDEIGVDKTYIGKIERGERSPSLSVIQEVARALDISIKSLFDFDEN